MLPIYLVRAIVVAFLFLPGVSLAQEPRAGDVFESMSSHLQVVRIKTKKKTEVNALVDAIEKSLATLKEGHQELSRSDGESLTFSEININGVVTRIEERTVSVTEFSDGYLASLRIDDELLNGLATSKVETSGLVESLTVVLDDLKIKSDYLNRGRFLEMPVTTSTVTSADLSVKTTTITNGRRVGDVLVAALAKTGNNQPVAGCTIYFVAKGLAKVPSRFQTFGTLSPTKPEYLSPGNYLMWAVKDGRTTSPRPVPIGNQIPPESVDISVPENWRWQNAERDGRKGLVKNGPK